MSFENDLEQTLIVYGTLAEAGTNLEAAQTLQGALRRREPNSTVPIKKDREVTAAELKDHHLLLIGRPDSNHLVAGLGTALPVSFGSHSVEVGGEVYAPPNSAVLIAAENPHNRRYSVMVIAGLSPAAILRVVPEFEEGALSYAEVVVLPHNMEEEPLVVPPKELTRELGWEILRR